MNCKHLSALALTLCVGLTTILTTARSSEKASADKSADKKLSVGFLCVGPVSDRGWNYSQEKARKYLLEHMPGQIETTLAEQIPESAEAERVLEKMIAKGNKLIFTASYGFLEPAMRVAERHPEVTFMQVNRFKTADNLGTFFSHQYQPSYLAGIVAGRVTKTDKIGYVAAHPVPVILQAINAFELGARSVNPRAEVQVVWINKWSDPALEAEAVKGLVESGADVIAHAQDNQNTILKICKSLGVKSVGFYSDAHELAPKGWLTGACLEWGPLYERIIHTVMDGTWEPKMITEGMEGGYIQRATFGDSVPESVRKEVLAEEARIKDGSLVIFKGPMKDRNGKEKLASGQVPTFKELSEMDWFVSGVKGSLPKSRLTNRG